MTREEAINALGIVKHMESFSVFYEPGEPMNQTTVAELKEACKMAISILRAQTDTTPNDPLTLAELQEMDGEPVWLLGDGLNRYDIFRGERSPGWADFYCGRFRFFCYGKDWLAYRRKPEEETA